MHNLGDANPLMALVEFSTAFDPQTLADVIQKLEVIEAGMIASLADDEADEAAAIETYNNLRGMM